MKEKKPGIFTRLTSEKNLGTLIFLFGAILSYGHTYEMFARSGYRGTAAHLGTLMVELMFWMGLSSLNRARRAGITQGRQARIAFWLGGAIVLYSNFTYKIAGGQPILWFRINSFWSVGEPEIIGIMIVGIVFVSESVIAYADQYKRTKEKRTDETKERTDGRLKTVGTWLTNAYAWTVEDVRKWGKKNVREEDVRTDATNVEIGRTESDVPETYKPYVKTDAYENTERTEIVRKEETDGRKERTDATTKKVKRSNVIDMKDKASTTDGRPSKEEVEAYVRNHYDETGEVLGRVTVQRTLNCSAYAANTAIAKIKKEVKAM